MSALESRQTEIIRQNVDVGNDPRLGELVAAYDVVYRRFHAEDSVTFYTEDPESSIRTVTELRPSVQRFIERNAFLDPKAAEFLVTYADLMRRQGLPFLFSVAHLMDYLGTTEREYNHLIANIEHHYHTTHIPKKRGGFRIVDAPSPRLKAIQSTINSKILRFVKLQRSATGFREGKSIRDNAHSHRNKYAVYGVDLENFFHSVHQSRVYTAFVNLGFTQSVARAITAICCFEGRLPMGAPTSPMISNIVASRLDRRLEGLAKVENVSYSRYADDLTLSFSSKSAMRIIPLVKEIIEEEGFRINHAKEEIRYQNQRQMVTGLVVNQSVNVRKNDYKKLRAVLHNSYRYGVSSEMKKWGADNLQQFRAQLLGHIEFIAMINKEKGERLRNGFRKLQWTY
jgi:RNA-directed DNA polymerase